MTITTIGIDIAKSVFQLHGVDEAGNVILRKKLRRSAVLDTLRQLEPCLVGMEACATAHYWAREISALGHQVKLMPPAHVKPYVKRGKNDMADAEAICEAVTRPTMRFVPVKSADRQAVLVLHRTRDMLMRQRTMRSEAIWPSLVSSRLRGRARPLNWSLSCGRAHMKTFLMSLAQRFWGSVCNSMRSGRRYMIWSVNYMPGIGKMRSATGWRPSPVSGSSRRRRSRPACRTRQCSGRAGSSRPSWVSHRG
jgi:hypothetical protein